MATGDAKSMLETSLPIVVLRRRKIWIRHRLGCMAGTREVACRMGYQVGLNESVAEVLDD